MLTAKKKIKIKGVTRIFIADSAALTTVRERGELETTKHDHTETNVTYESD